MRTAIRKVNDAVTKGNKEEAQSSYRAAVPIIDSMVNKNIIHRSQADRHKSRLAARVKGVGVAR
jgi:small subunit ribosomal protein S20